VPHPILGRAPGAFALSWALAAPATLPEHDALISVAFAVVAFSIFVQGMTARRLLSRTAMAEDQAPLFSSILSAICRAPALLRI